MLAVTILNLKIKYMSFLSKSMTDKFINPKACRNLKLCVKMQQECRKDAVLAAIFCFAYLKVNGTKDRMLSDRLEFSTPKLICKNKRKKNLHSNVEQSLKFHISAQAKYTHFLKRLQYSLDKKIYMSCTNIYTTQC